MPDESTILRFRRLLDAHEVTATIVATVRSRLDEPRLLLNAGNRGRDDPARHERGEEHD